jgi:hypothetical protein
MVATPTVAVELRGQLLARERELERREGAITAWEDGLVAFERVLGRVHIEHNASHVQAEATQQDYLARTCTFSSRSKLLIGLSRALEECQILICL